MANLLSMNSDVLSRLFKGRVLDGRLVCKKLCSNISMYASVVARFHITVDQTMASTYVDLENKTVRQLRKLCRSLQISSEGRKHDLVIRVEEHREKNSMDKERYWQCAVAEITKVLPRLKSRVSLIPYKYGRGEISRLLEKLNKVPNLTQIDLQPTSSTTWFSKSGEAGFEALSNYMKDVRSSLTALRIHAVKTFLDTDEAPLNAASAVHLASCFKAVPLLRTLDLQDVAISDECAVPLFDGLQHLTRLTELDLESSRLTGAGALYLAQALRCLPELTSLLLKGLPWSEEGEMAECLGPAGLRHIADGLRHTPRLTALDVSYAHMGDEGAAALAAALCYVPKLVRLHLCKSFSSTVAAESIFAALQHTPLLEALGISDVKGDEVALLLAAALHRVPLLTSLCARSCEISSVGAEALARELPALPRLVELDLSFNSIGAGAEALLAGATGLETLDLNRNRLGPADLPALSRGLVRATVLTSLNLSDNDFRGGGALLLAEGLRASPLLAELKISGGVYPLGPGSAKQLCVVLGRLPGLTHLHAQDHGFGPDGVRAIAEELARSCSRLVWLFLPGNGAGDAGAEALAAALPRWPQLKMLLLADNGIGDAGATRLADALRSGCSAALKGLLMNHNLFGAAGARRLLQAQRSQHSRFFLGVGWVLPPRVTTTTCRSSQRDCFLAALAFWSSLLTAARFPCAAPLRRPSHQRRGGVASVPARRSPPSCCRAKPPRNGRRRRGGGGGGGGGSAAVRQTLPLAAGKPPPLARTGCRGRAPPAHPRGLCPRGSGAVTASVARDGGHACGRQGSGAGIRGTLSGSRAATASVALAVVAACVVTASAATAIVAGAVTASCARDGRLGRRGRGPAARTAKPAAACASHIGLLV